MKELLNFPFKDNFSVDDFIKIIEIGNKSKNQNKKKNVKLFDASSAIIASCEFYLHTKKSILSYLYKKEKLHPVIISEKFNEMAEKGSLLPFINKNFKLINTKKKYEFGIIIEDSDGYTALCGRYNFHIIYSKINLSYYISFYYSETEESICAYTFFNKSFKSQNKAILFLNNFLKKQIGLNKDLIAYLTNRDPNRLKKETEKFKFIKNINKLIDT